MKGIDAALHAVRNGYKVLPVVAYVKNPLGPPKWQEWAATTEAAVVALFGTKPGAWAAVVPGSRNEVVIDEDTKEGKRGDLSVRKLNLPRTRRVRTVSGGYHHIFKRPEGMFISNNAGGNQGSWNEEYPDVDVRGDNGYVVYGMNDLYEVVDDIEPVELPQHVIDEFEFHGLLGDKNTATTVVTDLSALDEETRSTVNRMAALGWTVASMLRGTEYDDNAYQVRMGHPNQVGGTKGATVGYKHSGFVQIFTSSYVIPPGSYDIEQIEEAIADKTKSAPVAEPDAFYGPLGEATRLFAHTEADPSAIMMALVVGVGNMIGDGPYVEPVSNIRQHTRLNVLIVGSSAKARKSAAWGQAEHILEMVDPKWVDRIMGGFGSGHILVDQLSSINNLTVGEDLIQNAFDKRVLIREDEFVRVLKTVNNEGSIYSAILRSAFDGGKLEVRSRQKTSVVPKGQHHISLVGAITVEELQSTLTNTEAYNGFGNRILYVFARKTKNVAISDEELDETKLLNIVETLRLRVADAQGRGRLYFTDAGKEEWRRVYDELQADDPEGLLGTIIARSDVLTLRLALIFALVDGSNKIDKQHIQAGKAVWDYCRDTAAYVFKKRGNVEITGDNKKHDNLKTKMYDEIYNRAFEGMGLSEIKTNVANRNNVMLVDEVIKELIAEGLIESYKISEPGKRGPKPLKYFAKAFTPKED